MLGALIALSLAAQEPSIRSEGASDRALTIYRDGLAYVVERHEVDLPPGRSSVILSGVNPRMVPQTAVLLGFEGATLERNFDADLLSKRTLYEGLVGETVPLRRTDPESGASETVRARVISAGQGVVVETPEGIETLDCTGLGASLLAPAPLDAARAVPELSVVMEGAGGPASLTLAYLAREIGWSADYVLTLPETGEGEAALRGWLTMTNDTADAFDTVPAAIVAGSLNVGRETRAPYRYAPRYRAACWPRGSTAGPFPMRDASNPYLLGFPDKAPVPAPVAFAEAASYDEFAEDEIVVTGARASRARTATEERFGDYRLYRPPGPVTLAPYQTKQIAFLDEDAVDVRQRYAIELPPNPGAQDPLPAVLVNLIDNEPGGALARALPAGTVRMMTEADGETYYLGQDAVDDLAVGLPVEVEGGVTPLVRAYASSKRAAKPSGLPDRRERFYEVTVEIENRAPREAEVALRLAEWFGVFTLVEVVETDARVSERGPSDGVVARVPSGETATVTILVRTVT